MNKNRLENFSDGVFSIAATLLILNVKIPDTHRFNNQKLNINLLVSLPHLATFAFSFIVIGVFWVAHHRIFSFVKIPDGTLLWLNIFYLLFVATIPFSASILSENPFLPTAILLYTVTLFIIALMHFILLHYLLRNEHLKHEALTEDLYRSAKKIAVIAPICYIIAAVGSFINVYISFFAIAFAIVYSIFLPGKGKIEEQIISTAREEENK